MRARPAPPSVRRWRFAFRRSTALAVAATVLLAPACSDDDPSAADSSDDSTTTSRPTTTTEARRETSSVGQQIETLLSRYDEVTAEIVADPEIAGDRDHPLYDDLQSLLVPGTEMTQAVVSALVARGQRGEYQMPVEGEERPVERHLDGEVQQESENEVSFPICTLLQYRDFDAQDRQRRILPGLVEPGVGRATRIDGEWRLSRLETDDRTNCAESGS